MPGTLLVVVDHKSKTYPCSKFESMTEFFGKKGMSCLGVMIKWYGQKEGVEGHYVWFLDIIMDNVTSQDGRDLMPGIQCILDELKSAEFLRVYSDTNPGAPRPTQIILESDNALCNVAHTPFIELLNSRCDRLGTAKIIDFINNEAQRGKGFLDTHFRYVNMFIEAACLRAEIKLCDPKAFFDCLSYEGGMRASAVVLLQEDEEAQEMFDACKRVDFKKTGSSKTGSSRVHHIRWIDGTVEWRHFTELKSINQGFKSWEGSDLMPVTDIEHTGTVLKSSYSRTEPIFLPSKAPGQSVPFAVDAVKGRKPYVPPIKTIFAGRLYEAADWVHKMGISPEQLPGNTRAEVNVDGSKILRDNVEIQKLLVEARELPLCLDDEYPDLECPPTFSKYWATKTNNNWLKPSDELVKRIKDMYSQGKGYKNRTVRFTPEQAVSQLREQFLVDRWDQRCIVTVQLLKSKFGQWFQKEKKDADTQPKNALPVVPEVLPADPIALPVDPVVVDDDVVEDDDVELTEDAAAAFAKVFDAPGVELIEDVRNAVLEAEEIVNGEDE